MICRFCSQWNPEGEARCCFCQNALEAEVDATVSGRPGTGQLAAAVRPVRVPTDAEAAQASAVARELVQAEKFWRVARIVIPTVIFLLVMACYCAGLYC